jgi:hypothetical protein
MIADIVGRIKVTYLLTELHAEVGHHSAAICWASRLHISQIRRRDKKKEGRKYSIKHVERESEREQTGVSLSDSSGE